MARNNFSLKDIFDQLNNVGSDFDCFAVCSGSCRLCLIPQFICDKYWVLILLLKVKEVYF